MKKTASSKVAPSSVADSTSNMDVDAPTAATSATTTVKSKAAIRHRRKYTSFTTFIYKILRKTLAERAMNSTADGEDKEKACGISSEALIVLDDINLDVLDSIITEAVCCARLNKRQTLLKSEVFLAARLVLPPTLAEFAVLNARHCLARYAASTAE